MMISNVYSKPMVENMNVDVTVAHKLKQVIKVSYGVVLVTHHIHTHDTFDV